MGYSATHPRPEKTHPTAKQPRPGIFCEVRQIAPCKSPASPATAPGHRRSHYETRVGCVLLRVPLPQSGHGKKECETELKRVTESKTWATLPSVPREDRGLICELCIFEDGEWTWHYTYRSSNHSLPPHLGRTQHSEAPSPPRTGGAKRSPRPPGRSGKAPRSRAAPTGCFRGLTEHQNPSRPRACRRSCRVPAACW